MTSAIPDLTWILSVLWLAVGVGVALALSARGHAQEAAIAALVAWPFFLPMLGKRPPTYTPRGPSATRIDRTLNALRQALTDANADDAALLDLEQVADALHAADTRIARVDRVLLEEEGEQSGVSEERIALLAARDAAMADLDSVLAGLSQLRLQVGRLALAPDAAPIGVRLRELRARIGALGELG